jgi:hypothetical protein
VRAFPGVGEPVVLFLEGGIRGEDVLGSPWSALMINQSNSDMHMHAKHVGNGTEVLNKLQKLSRLERRWG